MADEPTAADIVRLLIAAPATNEVFTDDQIDIFLALEGGAVKLAAARAVSTIALNEALVSKVIRDGQLSTDGAKLSAELRALAKQLRDEHASDLDDDGYFDVVDIVGGC